MKSARTARGGVRDIGDIKGGLVPLTSLTPLTPLTPYLLRSKRTDPERLKVRPARSVMWAMKV